VQGYTTESVDKRFYYGWNFADNEGTNPSYLGPISDPENAVDVPNSSFTLETLYEVPSGSSGEEHNWDHPDSFDWDALINTVKKLKSGEPAQVPKHDFSKYKRIDNYKTIYPQSIIIVDGLFTLYNEKLIEMATYKIFVLCDEDISLSRRLKRDTEERGYSHEVVIERYFRHVKPSFRDYINPTKRRADIIIQNMGFCIEKNKGVEILIKCLTYTH